MPLDLPGYTEVRELGAGASGRVTLARYDATGQLVAVKVLSERLLADVDFRERFRREAETLGRVRHPNVVAMYGYHETPTQAVILMELVDGVALERIVERGPLAPEAALAVLSGALLGLEAAHAAGIVHRDVKPENVLVERRGGSRLVDFGVAVWSGQRDVPAGTPVYMAPEQWMGSPATPQADVYAATGVYYRCITGRWPLPGSTIAELREMHLRANPDVGMLPPAIGALVLRGMAKDPGRRPASAGAFHAELEAAAAAVHGGEWRERGILALGGAAGVFAALFPLAVVGAHGAAGAAAGAAWTGASSASAGTAGAGAGASAATAAAATPATAGGTASLAGAGASALRVGVHSVLVKGSIAAVLLAGVAVGGLAATHAGPFASTPASSVAAPPASGPSPAPSGTGASTTTGSSSSRASASGSEATATGAGLDLGFSHNSLFPAATGDMWTYRTSGATTSDVTQTVLSARPVSGGQNVVLRTTAGQGKPVTATYLFADDGRITASQVSSGSFGASTQGVTFVIPSRDDIVAGRSFTSTGTITISGTAAQTISFMTTTTGDGSEKVTVPAGTFTAYRLKIAIVIGSPQVAAFGTTINETVDLAENVGVVRVVSDFGNEDLVSSNLVR